MDLPGAEQRFHIRLIAGEYLVFALGQERDVGIDQVVRPILVEKLCCPSGSHIIKGVNVHA